MIYRWGAETGLSPYADPVIDKRYCSLNPSVHDNGGISGHFFRYVGGLGVGDRTGQSGHVSIDADLHSTRGLRFLLQFEADCRLEKHGGSTGPDETIRAHHHQDVVEILYSCVGKLPIGRR